MSLDLAGKRLELRRQLVPHVRHLAVLARPEHPGEHRDRAAAAEVVGRLSMTMAYVPIQAATGLDGALEAIARQNCDALLAFPDAVMRQSATERLRRLFSTWYAMGHVQKEDLK